jgi:uncharacterized protein (TIGR01244 family)
LRLERTRTETRAAVAAIVVLCSLSASAASPDPGGLRSRITIDNFGMVNENYYRGAQPEGHDYADLAAAGIKTVVDLTADGQPAEARLAKQAGMTFYRIPMSTHDRPRPDQVAEFLRIVGDAANQPVYVHCQGGRHRTGTMTAVYRMTHDGWTADRAFAEMQQYKFGPGFLHSALKDFVYDYGQSVDRSNSVLATVVTGAGTSKPR